MQKKSFLTPLGFVRQYNSPKPYSSPSIIIQGNFHLSIHPRERFDRGRGGVEGRELDSKNKLRLNFNRIYLIDDH